ncbi:MAG: P-loop NTPase [Nitrospirota bacterium]
MAATVSVASGKGGVGKSVVASNLALLLARRGKRVVVVDMDVGGANIHILFGMVNPPGTLTDFLARRVESLEDVAYPFEPCPTLRIIPGTGDTLATANMPYARKKRLIKHLKQLSADVVLIDVGPGTNYHSLDFFLMADHYLMVATSDPTSVLDLYRFIKLAAIRRVLSAFAARGGVAEALVDRDFTSMEEVLEAAGKAEENALTVGRDLLKTFHPGLIVNRVSGGQRMNTLKLKALLKEYVGGELTAVGEIPEDAAVGRSVRAYLPVIEHAPESPAAKAFERIADWVVAHVDAGCDVEANSESA